MFPSGLKTFRIELEKLGIYYDTSECYHSYCFLHEDLSLQVVSFIKTDFRNYFWANGDTSSVRGNLFANVSIRFKKNGLSVRSGKRKMC